MGQGDVGRCHLEGDSAWQLLQLTALSVPVGPFVCFLAQTGVENPPFTLQGLDFRQLLVWRTAPWSEGPDY